MIKYPSKIISGGQTGADQGGLFGAANLGLSTGGFAPRGWVTDAGSAPWLAQYGLIEFGRGYPPRTKRNVESSNGTVLFGNTSSPGTRLTIRLCRENHKPYITNPSPAELRRWCQDRQVEVLNVAGNRERSYPGLSDYVRKLVEEAFK